MVKRKETPGGGVSERFPRKSPRSANTSPTMSDSAKPKSSTSEASKKQPRKLVFKRSTGSSDDDDDDDDLFNSFSESAKPKASAIKPKAPITEPSTTKTSATKRKSIQKSNDSDDESEDVELSRKIIKTKPNTSAPSTAKKPTAKKQPIKPPFGRDIVDDYEDESDEDDTKSRSKAISSNAKELTAEKAAADPFETSDTEDGSEDDSDEGDSITKPKSSVSTKAAAGPSKNGIPQDEPEEDDDDDEDEEEDPTVTFSEAKGDLFGAPSKSLLLHACNCEGSWNKGIAYQFQKNYPDHYAIYHNHCRDNEVEDIIGHCLLIPPQRIGKNHWVGCLFTSRKYGRGKDKKDKILDQTERTMEDLIAQIEEMDERPKAVWMCKINSGMFRVPWGETKEKLEYLTCEGGLHISIVDKK